MTSYKAKRSNLSKTKVIQAFPVIGFFLSSDDEIIFSLFYHRVFLF